MAWGELFKSPKLLPAIPAKWLLHHIAYPVQHELLDTAIYLPKADRRLDQGFHIVLVFLQALGDTSPLRSLLRVGRRVSRLEPAKTSALGKREEKPRST